ncbi:MAG TPA: CBS domain-containing protein [Actinopolymorphaceae bacterium]|nr:CBS domain-containing protein [Actinopolymorphaceae bacterium]
MPTDESRFLDKLEVEVEAELGMARSSHPEEVLGESPAEWLFDPTDVQREEIGLRSLLGAVEALEGDAQPDREADATSTESSQRGRLPTGPTHDRKEQFMSPDTQTPSPPEPMVEEDAHLGAAEYLMKHAGTSALVVLDDVENRTPVGLITETELVDAAQDGMDANDVRVRDVMTDETATRDASTSTHPGRELEDRS